MKKNKIKFPKIKNNIIKKIILFLLFPFLIIAACLLYYLRIILSLEDVEDLKTLSMPKSSIIYDKDGQELYKIYSEKRTYVDFEHINTNMINAIIAGEDKRFWTHPGYDKIGITRAVYNGLLNGNHFTGTSGITQQLVKITYLTNERTIERKLKELYLSTELSTKYEKKDILELYLNKVFFGGNSYGIEQASETYFGKKAIDLGVLESSILASLPKAPSGLSPYNKKDKLLGYPVFINNQNNLSQEKLLSKEEIDNKKTEVDLLLNYINKLTVNQDGSYLEICGIDEKNIKLESFSIDSYGCIELKSSKLLLFLNSISIKYNEGTIEYRTGRKDYVLGRMLEDKYITFEEYKEAFVGSFGLEFKEYRDDIKYPHFVMYVRNYLEKKYSKEVLKNGGFKIYTTIDPSLQDKAQELIEKRVEINTEKYGAKNAALISLDNETGHILSMVGGVDYFDEENLGYNNMILARLQPGSTFKPFIYMLAMIKKSFTKYTIFTDEKFTFPGDYTPKNSDGKYMGKMTLSKALNYSRNIPAVKIYYAAGEEEEIIKFLRDFGIKSLDEVKEEYKEIYGYNYVYAAPMALGTVQITPIELAQAYSVFANKGIKNELTSILKIVDFDGKIIEEFNSEVEGIKVLEQKDAYQINTILSSVQDRPKDWNYFLTIPGRSLAAKTGTSSKQYKKDPEDKEDSIFPKDMWTVGYTPQITTVVWAGNTSGEELSGDAYGINGAGLIMKDFMIFAHKDLEVKAW